jgi:hypothetical protein
MRGLLIAVAGILLLATPWSVATSSDKPKQRVFTGAAKCKTCHKSVEQGEQYRLWTESAHAKAYEVLASDEAKAVAKERGIANPQEAAECLRCHVTGQGIAAEFLGPKYTVTEGVSCESCHGAGGDYDPKKTMEGITAGTIDGATVGLAMPTEATCTGCHNKESPSFKGFDFKTASEKIKHPLPADRKAKYKATSP